MEQNDLEEGQDLGGGASSGPESGGAGVEPTGGAGGGLLDPDTGLEQEPAIDPDPVDDANPETDGVG